MQGEVLSCAGGSIVIPSSAAAWHNPIIRTAILQPPQPPAARQTKLIFNWNIFLRSLHHLHHLHHLPSSHLLISQTHFHRRTETQQRLRKEIKLWCCWKCILQIQAETATEKCRLKCGLVKWYKYSRRRNYFCECNVTACRYFPLNLCGEREDWTKITSPVTSSEQRGRRWVQMLRNPKFIVSFNFDINTFNSRGTTIVLWFCK